MRWFSGRHALHGADDRRRPRPAHVPECQARGQCIRVRLVVKQDEHPVGVRKVTLVLLHPGPGEGPAQFGRERRRDELAEVEMRDFRHHRPQLVLAALIRNAVGVQDVEQAAARVANRGYDSFQALFAGVLDDDAGAGREIRADVGIHATDVRDGCRHPVFNETPGKWPAFDKELNVERPRENAMQGPDDQLVLTDG